MVGQSEQLAQVKGLCVRSSTDETGGKRNFESLNLTDSNYVSWYERVSEMTLVYGHRSGVSMPWGAILGDTSSLYQRSP